MPALRQRNFETLPPHQEIIPMKITYSIGVRFAGGGIGNIAWHAVRTLYRRGILQLLLCSSARPIDIPPQQQILEMGMAHRILRRLAIYDSSRRLEYLQGDRYDVWAKNHLGESDIFHGWSNFARRSLQEAHIKGMVTVLDWPISHHVHQYQLLQQEYARWGAAFRPIPRWKQRADEEIAQADVIITPSDYARNSFLTQGIPANQVISIPFGVDAQRFSPPTQRLTAPIRFLFVGQIGLRKGVQYLLDAWSRLRLPNAELWLVGRVQSSFQPVLKRFHDLPGLHIIPYTERPEDLYQTAHVFVFPSLDEGSALVTYEAMAAGLPLIVTHHSGSVARNGIESIEIPEGDVPALMEAMALLAHHEDMRLEMGERSRQRILPFTWERYGSQLISLYQSILPA